MNVSVIVFIVFLSANVFAQSIVIAERDAEVWYPQQRFSGSIDGLDSKLVHLHHNETATELAVQNGAFSFELELHRGKNRIWIESQSSEGRIKSNTVEYTLMYRPMPEIRPFIEIQGDSALLSVKVLQNPRGTPSFSWTARQSNPALAELTTISAGTASVVIPPKDGKYYFDLFFVSGEDSLQLTTYCVRDGNALEGSSYEKGHSSWIDDAIMYEVTPYKFVDNGKLADITAKLPELKSFGINCIWLQPITQSFQKGQGYDVINYMEVSQELGNAEDLRRLISTAKELGMRVIFDIVPNHTSIHHPYAIDVIANGKQSHYYDYYQHDFDGAPYASFYNKHPDGFVYYFWKDLVNLNFNNQEVQQWMLEICKFWVKEFGIDGFRFDAVWAVNARAPLFMKKLGDVLKSINPDLLMLAEDKPLPSVYKNGFDAAYDWTADTSWVSHWSWQYEYHERKSFTVFNHPQENLRVSLLTKALFNTASDSSLRLRFMENNDLPRFINDHTLDQTKMVATLLFSLPGIPMLYNGQEVGFTIHPYSKGSIFRREQSIESLDTTGLLNHYRKLMLIRNTHGALRSDQVEKVYESSQNGILVFKRWNNDELIYIAVNLSRQPYNLDVDKVLSEGKSARAFVDLLSGKRIKKPGRAGRQIIHLAGFSTSLLQEQP